MRKVYRLLQLPLRLKDGIVMSNRPGLPRRFGRSSFILLKLALGMAMFPGCIITPLHASNDGQTDSDAEIPELEADTYRTTPSEELSSKIWKSTVGHGMRAGVRHVGVDVGPALGMKILGGMQEHDFALMRIQYGLMLDGAFQPEGSTLGNWEVIGELFAGNQFEPKGAYLVGVAPVLRCHVNTGTRWMPFVDLGAGFSATDIGLPDLRTVFEFNVQGGAGFNYFLWDDTAITAQYRFLHLSNAGLKRPNLGVNTNVIYVGLNHFF
jgi:hypothetical protein